MPKPTDAELAGAVLHGDDFAPAEIAAWYQDEENAYAEMHAEGPDFRFEYENSALNTILGFNRLPDRKFPQVVGLGSAFGDEFLPIQDRIEAATIIDSAEGYLAATTSLSLPIEQKKAQISGDISLPDGYADLVTCFGVLHHISNVSHVFGEIGRITKSGGFALVREPVISMGDWSEPRPGLTPRERGIPIQHLRRAAEQSGFDIREQTWCCFSLTSHVARVFGIEAYDRLNWVRVDLLLSRLFRWNYRYHAFNKWQKIRPTSVFLVLHKR